MTWSQTMGMQQDGLHLLGTIDIPMFLIKHDAGWALVDASVEPLAPRILQQLEAICGDLTTITHWFITHSHYDHIGTLALLYPWLPAVKVYASEATSNTLKNPKAHAVTAKLTSSLYNILPEAEHASAAMEAKKVDFADIPINCLADGDTVTLSAGHQVVAVATPGHAKCLLSFYEPKFKRLYVSDTLGEMVSPTQWEPLIFQDYQAYQDSLRKLQQLEVNCLVLGHHGVLYGEAANVAAASALQGLTQFKSRAARLLNENEGDLNATAQVVSDITRQSTEKFITKKLHYNGTLLMMQLMGFVGQPELS